MPSVTELVEAIARSRGIAPDRRHEVFRAAQQVCAEELRLTRTGFSPAPVAELAERAVRLLPSDLGGERIVSREWSEDAPFPEEPLVEAEFVDDAGAPFPREGESASAPDLSERAGESDGRFPFEPRARLELPVIADETSAPHEAESVPEEAAEEEEPSDEVEFETVERAAPPSGGKLAAFLLVLAIGGGVWFFAKTRRVPAPPTDSAGPAGATNAAPAVTPSPAAPTESRGPAETSSPAPGGPAGTTAPVAAPSPPPPSLPESRGSTMISPDQAGAPVWMIHFSSYQRKENAERDAARLAKILGRPLRIVSVNLGKPGIWYRVMLGDYASREEAEAERSALAARETPGLGFVYRVEPAPGARDETR